MSTLFAGRRSGSLLIAAAALAGVVPSFAQTLTVTSLADDGPGSLRAQLVASRSVLSPQIDFAVSGTINLLSPLVLQNTNNLTVDGGGQITLNGGGDVQVLVYLFPHSLTLNNLTITGGNGFCGGAIRSDAFLHLKNVTIRGNTAKNGGGLCVLNEQAVVDSSTFENNSAELDAGAIFVAQEGSLVVVNSTFTNNRAARGGAILNNTAAGARITNTTISDNAAQTGGGLLLGQGSGGSPSYQLTNSIFSSNTGGNCATSLITFYVPGWVDQGGNISYPDNTCPGTVADPKLGPLASNGGPTQTMALQTGSAAVDHAIDCQLTTDQRGYPRPQGPACDSGSYEKSALAFTGFSAPISNLPEVNHENPGRAIPILFGVGQFIGMDIFAAGYPASRPVSCATGQPTGPLAPIDTPGNSGLTYDQFQDQYSVNWKTSKAWAGQCRELVVRLTDGVDHTALFRFR
jgi:hypothetical protein